MFQLAWDTDEIQKVESFSWKMELKKRESYYWDILG
jgi:hypothetical protein